MNSEEIKEIGQMFLNIQNNTENKSNSVVDHKLVSEEIKEKIHISEQGTETRVLFLDEEIKKLKLELHKVECKLLPPTDNYILDTVKELTAKKLKELTAKVDELGTKTGELGYKVGGYGGLISSLQKKEGERTKELNKIRKDYRELQDEMWERFNLIEEWLLAHTSRDKQKFRDEIIDIRTDHEKQKKQNKLSDVLAKTYQEKQEARVKVDATNEQDVLDKTYSDTRKAALEVLQRKADNEKPKNKWLNWETPTSLAWGKTPISKLELSVRSHNALITGGYHYVGNIITQSPHDLIQIRNFGRKCLREVMKALEEKNLTLNMQKFKEQRTERYAKGNTQRGNLYGIKQ